MWNSSKRENFYLQYKTISSYLNIFLQETDQARAYKLYGLALFGNPSASNTIATLAAILEQDHANEKIKLPVFGLAIPIRQGDANSLRRLQELMTGGDMSSLIYGPELLWACGSKEAIDALANCAANRDIAPLQRLACIEWLGRAGDKRFWDIAFSPELKEDIKKPPVDLFFTSILIAQVTGDAKIEKLETEAEIKEYIIRNHVTLPVPVVRLSVQGGIDWSTVDWEKLLKNANQ